MVQSDLKIIQHIKKNNILVA